MSDSNPLWQEVYAALKGHQSPPRDPTPQATLDRIAAKRIHLTFNPNNCDIHEEFLSLEELKRLKRYSEDDDRPNIEVEPIVVLVYGEHGNRFRKRDDTYRLAHMARSFWSSTTEYSRTSSSSFENGEALGILSAAKRCSQERT